jgi:fructoselysine-6-P-deglycase FrlB-like protein/predicted NBD/HSP70 family sugar kinase
MHQPDVWLTAGRELPALVAGVREWIQGRGHDEVWFCGAGTSAFIGESVSAYLNERRTPARYRAVPTTELVAHPQALLRPGMRRLLVSFGRSGESPETLATLALLDRTDADALHITCNADGALARSEGPRQRALVLPPETHDAGFAMTSSYSTMLLYALACFDDLPIADIEPRLRQVASAGRDLLEATGRIAARLAPPQRMAFLGGGELMGAARESALKVLELTAGRVAAFWDSPLGFRHGPKSLVNDQTRMVVLLSPDPDARRYDDDIVVELRGQYGTDRVITVGTVDSGADLAFAGIPAGWNVPLYVLPAQLLAVTWSDSMGFNVDDPFPDGQLSRVVQGVRIYPPSTRGASLYGGMDVGGSKIETCLFDEQFQPLERRRVDTNCATYEQLLDCIVGEARWLDARAGRPVQLGIGLPGLFDPASGRSLTSNLPATGLPLREDLTARLGRAVAMGNDTKLFALSEANGGAGEDAETMLGLILGTGVGAGVTYRGRLVRGYNDLPGEVGHLGIPGRFIAELNLPLLVCGCGRTGCYETLLAGPGLTRLAGLHYQAAARSPAEIVKLAAEGDPAMAAALRDWLTLLAELINTAQCTIDMDCVVLGGGLSRIPDVARMLAKTYRSHQFAGREPRFAVARFGDASGTRGAALLLAQS